MKQKEIAFKLYLPDSKILTPTVTLKYIIAILDDPQTPEDFMIASEKDSLLWLQFSGVLDKNKNPICEDDILKGAKGETYRIYLAPGGFVIKTEYWAKDQENLDGSDMLITEPLADAQTYSYVSLQCEIIGNYNLKNKDNNHH